MTLKKLFSLASLIALPLVASACYVEPAYGRVYHRPYAYAPRSRIYVAPPAPPVVVIRPAPRPYW